MNRMLHTVKVKNRTILLTTDPPVGLEGVAFDVDVDGPIVFSIVKPNYHSTFHKYAFLISKNQSMPYPWSGYAAEKQG